MPMSDNKIKAVDRIWKAIHENNETLHHLDPSDEMLKQLVLRALWSDGNALSSPDAMEAGLIERVRWRDENATSALYKMNDKIVYAFLLVRLYDKDDAEALTNDTFSRAFDAIQKGRYQRGEIPFSAYLLAIAGNILHEKRREVEEDRKRKKNLIWDKSNAPENELDPLDILVHLENENEIWNLVRELNRDEQTVFALRHSYGLSYEEIAPVLGRDPRAAKQLYYRARKKLAAKATSWKRSK